MAICTGTVTPFQQLFIRFLPLFTSEVDLGSRRNCSPLTDHSLQLRTYVENSKTGENDSLAGAASILSPDEYTACQLLVRWHVIVHLLGSRLLLPVTRESRESADADLCRSRVHSSRLCSEAGLARAFVVACRFNCYILPKGRLNSLLRGFPNSAC